MSLDRGRLAGWSALVLALAALGYATRAAEGKPDQDVLFKYATAVNTALFYGIILAIVLAIAWSHPELLALRRPSSLARAFYYGFIALITAYVVGAIVTRFADPGDEQGLPKHWEPGHAGAYAANFVVVVLFAPIVEELMFRGLGFSLLRPLGEVPAVLGVGVAFGIYHGLLVALPVLMAFGAALALVRARTNSIFPGMVTHAIFNGITMVVILSR